MFNILVVDVQNGFITERNEEVVFKINEHLKNNEFQHAVYTQFVTNHEGNSYKNIFWDGLYDKQERKIAVKKLKYSKVFKKRSHGLSPAVFKYLEQNNITDIQLCGIDNNGSMNLIYASLKYKGIKVELLEDLIYRSCVEEKRRKSNHLSNLTHTVNGFYVGDILGGANATAVVPEDIFLNVNELSTYSDCTALSFAVMEWLHAGKHDEHEMLKILNYYYKFYPIKGGDGYNLCYSQWAKNGFRSYRLCNDNVAIKMCSPISMYAKSLQQVDELINKSILPANNSEDSILGAKLQCYAMWHLKYSVSRSKLLNTLKKYFNEDLFDDFDKCLDDLKQEQSSVNTARLAIQIFVNTESYIQALEKAISCDIEKRTLCSAVSALCEAYYKNLPYKEFNKCRELLPEGFKKVLLDFWEIKGEKADCHMKFIPVDYNKINAMIKNLIEETYKNKLKNKKARKIKQEITNSQAVEN